MTQSITAQQAGSSRTAKTVINNPPHAAGLLWVGGWLFAIGFLKLVWWKALLGLFVWPYFLGAYFAR